MTSTVMVTPNDDCILGDLAAVLQCARVRRSTPPGILCLLLKGQGMNRSVSGVYSMYCRYQGSTSMCNPGEGEFVARLCQVIIRKNVAAAKVGIITPYKGQMIWLQNRLRQLYVDLFWQLFCFHQDPLSTQNLPQPGSLSSASRGGALSKT